MSSVVGSHPQPEPGNPCAGVFGAVYDFYIERPSLSRLIGGLVWGIDVGPYYTSMGAIGSVAEGGVVLDVPCGGGVALRGLERSQQIDYLAVDLDQRMLDRTTGRARSRKLDQVEVLRADAAALPVATGTVDLALSYGGLHCFSQPATALAELARCLRPAGRLLGSTFAAPGNLRQRILLGGQRRRLGLPELWNEEQLRRRLSHAGFADIRLAPSGGHILFEAARPGRGQPSPGNGHVVEQVGSP